VKRTRRIAKVAQDEVELFISILYI
jgi:hypothetical protein